MATSFLAALVHEKRGIVLSWSKSPPPKRTLVEMGSCSHWWSGPSFTPSIETAGPRIRLTGWRLSFRAIDDRVRVGHRRASADDGRRRPPSRDCFESPSKNCPASNTSRRAAALCVCAGAFAGSGPAYRASGPSTGCRRLSVAPPRAKPSTVSVTVPCSCLQVGYQACQSASEGAYPPAVSSGTEPASSPHPLTNRAPYRGGSIGGRRVDQPVPCG
jgi:hypothetical protein